jgi:hypothetical protein
MIIRITRIFALALFIASFLGIRPALGEGWSPPKLFPQNKNETKQVPVKQTKHQPSMMDKMTSGPKKFFNNVGSTLGLKKSAPPKKTYTPSNPWIKPAKDEPAKSSWLTSIFPKEEPKKPSNPSEWLQQERMNP